MCIRDSDTTKGGAEKTRDPPDDGAFDDAFDAFDDNEGFAADTPVGSFVQPSPGGSPGGSSFGGGHSGSPANSDGTDDRPASRGPDTRESESSYDANRALDTDDTNDKEDAYF